MMKSLAGILLPAGLQWPDAARSLATRHVVRTDLAGGPVIFAPTAVPRPITLVAGEDYGWLPEATAAALLALAPAAAPHTLVWGALTLPVAFAGQPAIDLTRLWPAAPWYVGTINLIALE